MKRSAFLFICLGGLLATAVRAGYYVRGPVEKGEYVSTMVEDVRFQPGDKYKWFYIATPRGIYETVNEGARFLQMYAPEDYAVRSTAGRIYDQPVTAFDMQFQSSFQNMMHARKMRNADPERPQGFYVKGPYHAKMPPLAAAERMLKLLGHPSSTEKTVVATTHGIYFSDEGGAPGGSVVVDPHDAGSQVAQLTGAANNEGYPINLGAQSIADNSVGTAFFRLRLNGTASSISACLSDENPGTQNWWDEDEAGVYHNGPNSGALVRTPNGGDTAAIALTPQWHNFWAVVDHSANAFAIYMSSGSDAATGDPTSVTVDPASGFNDATVGDLIYFWFVRNSGPIPP